MTQQTDIPEQVRALLSTCPKTGGGVHKWLFKVALKLHSIYQKDADIVQLLRLAVQGCGRNVPDAEIVNAIRNSHPDKLDGDYRPNPSWPEADKSFIAKLIQEGPGASELESSSPVPLGLARSDSRAEEIIDVLFPDNPLICTARFKWKALTQLREEARGRLAHRQFIVPSPMSARSGTTNTGEKDRPRCSGNVAARRFLVIEFDPLLWKELAEAEQHRFGTEPKYYQAKRDEQAALLWHLAKLAPLAAIVFSGSKSLHGWFYCNGQPEDKLRTFMSYATRLGADPATWVNCQWVRMPDGTRDNGKLQATIYLNPEVIK